jgi:hypothetical protein
LFGAIAHTKLPDGTWSARTHIRDSDGTTCAALHDAAEQITSPTAAWTIPTPADPHVRAMILAEAYRRTVDGRPVWKL